MRYTHPMQCMIALKVCISKKRSEKCEWRNSNTDKKEAIPMGIYCFKENQSKLATVSDADSGGRVLCGVLLRADVRHYAGV